MHKLLNRIDQAEKDAHPQNPMYEKLMGSVVAFAEDYTAESSIKAAESDASAAKFESAAAMAQLETANTEVARLVSELTHAQELSSKAAQNLEALSAEVKQMKADWRAEKKELTKEGKPVKQDSSMDRAEIVKLFSKLEASMKKAKAIGPAEKPVESHSPMPIFDITVEQRGVNDKIKKVTLTPRGIF